MLRLQMSDNYIWQVSQVLKNKKQKDMKEYYRMVIELCKQSIAIHQVNPERSLEVLTELEKAITTAKIKGLTFDELQELKADVEQLRALNV